MKRLLAFVLIAVVVALSGTAYSSTATNTLDVRTTIIPTCSVSTTAVNFGSHDGSAGANANGDVTVTCASGTVYNIALDAGQNHGQVYYQAAWRAVSDGLGNFIAYSLSNSSGEWGDSDFANTYPVGASLADTGNGSAQPHTVNGMMIWGSFPSGLYTDVVTVTVHY